MASSLCWFGLVKEKKKKALKYNCIKKARLAFLRINTIQDKIHFCELCVYILARVCE